MSDAQKLVLLHLWMACEMVLSGSGILRENVAVQTCREMLESRGKKTQSTARVQVSVDQGRLLMVGACFQSL